MHPRTPSSILRKRANKENEGRETRKGRKNLGRRVSFAPDDELETMHLYQKERDKSGQPSPNLPATEDLAARIPLAMQELNLMALPGQGCLGAGADGLAPGVGAGASAPVPSLLAMMSPGAMLSPMSTSMDLTNGTNGSEDAAARGAAQHAPRGIHSAAGNIPGFEFTTNITSTVPALSTLIEEDEDTGSHSAAGGSSEGDAPPGAGVRGQPTHGSPPAVDATVSMELTMAATSSGAGGSMGGCGSPLELLPGAGWEGGADGPPGNMLLTPTSPFALNEMLKQCEEGGLSPGAHAMAGAGEVGVRGPGADASLDLKDKWGFTPGADDTLDVSHGRRVMGDTTYNHVYGSGTLGDLTLAMNAAAKPGGVTRSAVAAAANAAATGVAGVRAPAPAPGGADMTINLLADDLPTAGAMWQSRFTAVPPAAAAAVSTLTGYASVASSKPTAQVPGAPGDAAGASPGLGGVRAGASFGRPATGAGVTLNNWTAQLLVDGTATAGPLGAFMQGGKVQGVAGAAFAPPRDDVTSASSAQARLPSGVRAPSAALPRQTSPAGADATVGSLDFQQLALGGGGLGGAKLGGGGSLDVPLFEDGSAHTLDDFQPPPELAQHGGAALGGMAPSPLGAAAVSSPWAQGMTPRRWPTGTPSLPDRGAGPANGGSAGEAMDLMGDEATPPPPSALPPRAPPPPPIAPISFQEFLGLVEIRFLDDMRRRTSFVQPYDLGVLGAGPKPRAAPPALSEALEARFVAGPAARLAADSVRTLAERVEALQARAAATELDLARHNPPLFQVAQAADDSALEEVRDMMKVLKRVCRHRTVLSWKRTRIEAEQRLAAAWRDVAAELEDEAAAMQGACEQVAELMRGVEVAASRLQQRTQSVQEDTRVQQGLRERDAAMAQRVAEMAAANGQRRKQLQDMAARRAVVQGEYEDILQRQASLRQQLQALQGQGILRRTPDRGSSSSATPRGGKLPGGADQAARLQAQLDALLSLQGLQLDLRPCASAADAEADSTAAPAAAPNHLWSVVILGAFKVSIFRAPGDRALCAAPDRCLVQTVSLQQVHMSPLFGMVMAACMQGAGRTTTTWVPADDVAADVRRRVLHLSCVCGLVAQLEALLLRLPQLTSVGIAAPRAGASAPDLALRFTSLGPSSDALLPCTLEVRVRCGAPDAMLRTPGAGTLDAAVLVPAGRAAALTASLRAALARPEASTSWHGLCAVVTRWLDDVPGAGPTDVAEWSFQSRALCRRTTFSTVTTNPLFA